MTDEPEVNEAEKPAETAAPAPAAKAIPVVLKRAHWIGELRHEIGEAIEVDFETALRLIENGVAGRTDPLKAE